MKKKVLIIGIVGIFLLIQPLRAQTWIATKRLTWNSGGSFMPTIATDSTNTIHVVWYDATPGNNEIYYKRSTNGGVNWSGAKRLTWNSGASGGAAITVDSSDTIHVVWSDTTPGNSEIYYKKSTDGGVSWSGAKRLTWNSGESIGSTIAVDSSNTIHVVWHDNTPGNYEIYYRKSTDGGVSWSGAKRLTWNSGPSEDQAIAVDSSNTIHVVWTDYTPGNYEIYYKKSMNGGVSWSGAKRLTWTSGDSFFPTIAVDSSNTIHVGWHDATPGNAEIYYKRSTNGGVNWSGAKRLTWNSGVSSVAAIAVDSSNTIHVVWNDATPGNYEIYYKKSTDGGVSWSGAKRLTWTSGYSFFPIIAVDSNSNIHLVWYDLTPGNWEIYYKKGIQ